MATVICHLSRADRGAKLRDVRLIGLHGEDAWAAPPLATEVDPIEATREDARAASDWVAETLPILTGANGRGKTLDRICVDTDGAVCAWVQSAVADASLVRAEVARQVQVDPGDGEGMDDMGGFESPPRFPTLDGELGVEPLAVEAAGVDPESDGAASKGPGLFRGAAARGKASATGRGSANRAGAGLARVGVVATPDVPARLFVDELDRCNIAFGPVVSLWHVIGAVWDPSASRRGPYAAPRPPRDATPGDAADVVDMPAPASSVAASVVVDPATSRTLWTWTADGIVLAAGSMRSADGKRAASCEAVGGRLIAEWLSWSAQLGTAPESIVVVAPVTGLDPVADEPRPAALPEHDPSAEAPGSPLPGDDAPRQEPQGVAGLAQALARGWPGAGLDIVTDEDPIGLTLRRYAERVDAGRDPLAAGDRPLGVEMRSLSDRPVRAHRWMYRWGAEAMFAAAIAVGVVGWRVRASASELNAAAAGVRTEQRELLEQIDPSLDWRFPTRELDRLVESVRTDTGGEPPFEAPPPILEAVEAVAFVIGAPDFELESLSVTDSFVQIALKVEALESYEDLREAFANVAGMPAELESQDITEQSDGRLRVTFVLLWKRGAGDAS